jgi:hypothetical protein
MVNQTGEFQVLGAGSTFNNSMVYEVSFPYSHHPTLGLYSSRLNPAHVLTPCYCAKAATLISSVQRRLACDAASLGDWFATLRRIVVAREWATILPNVEKYSLRDTASQPRTSESSATTTVLEFRISQHLAVSSPHVIGREYIWRRMQIMQILLSLLAAWSPKKPLDNTGCPKSLTTVFQTVKELLGRSVWVLLITFTVHTCHSPCVVESPHKAELLTPRQLTVYYGQRSVTRLL